MSAITFACPKCDTILKTIKPIPAGKKVRCPKCSHVFAPPSSTVQESIPIRAEPPVRAPAPRRQESDDSGWEPVEDEAPPPARKPPRKPRRFEKADEQRANDGDTEDLDDRPRPKKRRKHKATGVNQLVKLYLLLGAVTLLLLAGGGGIAAWLYINWDKNRGIGNEDPLAYIPADSTIIAGFDVGTLMNHPAVAAQVEKSFKENQANTGGWFKEVHKETGLEFKDLFEHTICAMKPPAAPGRALQSVTVILKSKVAFDQNKIRKCCKSATPRKYKGKTYFEVSEGPFKTLFMPSNWMIIFTNVPEAQVQSMIDSNGTQPGLPADALGLAQQAVESTAWVVALFDHTMKQAIQQGMAQAGPMMPANVGEMLGRAKGASLSGTVQGNAVLFRASLVCPDEPSAKQAADGMQSMWDKQGKGQIALATAFAPPFMGSFLKELTDSLQFSSQGTLAQASAQVSVPVLETLVKEAQNQPAAAPGLGPPGGFPGQPGRPGRSTP
jgi:hypothetical protein